MQTPFFLPELPEVNIIYAGVEETTCIPRFLTSLHFVFENFILSKFIYFLKSVFIKILLLENDRQIFELHLNSIFLILVMGCEKSIRT